MTDLDKPLPKEALYRPTLDYTKAAFTAKQMGAPKEIVDKMYQLIVNMNKDGLTGLGFCQIYPEFETLYMKVIDLIPGYYSAMKDIMWFEAPKL